MGATTTPSSAAPSNSNQFPASLESRWLNSPSPGYYASQTSPHRSSAPPVPSRSRRMPPHRASNSTPRRSSGSTKSSPTASVTKGPSPSAYHGHGQSSTTSSEIAQ